MDDLAYAERMAWVENSEAFIGARKLRKEVSRSKCNELMMETLEAETVGHEELGGASRRDFCEAGYCARRRHRTELAKKPGQV